MKLFRLALILFILLAFSFIPSTFAEEPLVQGQTQKWCFEPDTFFYGFEPCMTVTDDGYEIIGKDRKRNIVQTVYTWLHGHRVSRQVFHLTIWQFLAETFFTDIGVHELRFLEIKVHQTDKSTYEGTATGVGLVWYLTYEYKIVNYEYDIVITTGGDAGEEFNLSFVEEASQ